MRERPSIQHVGPALSDAAGATTTGARTAKRRIWWMAPIAAIVLTLAAIWANASLSRVLERQRASELGALLRSSVEGLRAWFAYQESLGYALAGEPGVLAATRALRTLRDSDANNMAEALREAPEQAALAGSFRLLIGGGQYEAFHVVADDGLVLASSDAASIGRDIGAQLTASKAWTPAEAATIRAPYRNAAGAVRMALAVPITDNAKRVATLRLVFDPALDFARLLRATRSGESGETYAFNRDGTMVSESRFEGRLEELGLVDPREGSAILGMAVRDPGVDLTQGETPQGKPADWPLTRAAAAALKDGDGHDVHGYRDYRGVEVIGAWAWLDKYGIGIVTEQDVAEAFVVRNELATAMTVLLVLLTLVTAVLLGVGHVASVLQNRNRKVEQRVQSLGQYTLTEKLGEGGMGAVYRGHHTMLRRPTAIKLLKGATGASGGDALKRFEREVRMTSQLTHPNTIAVYDYGKTPDGTFYYAMELLDGADLDVIVVRTGPLSAARAIHVLLQVCGSLHEAHQAGLIHRDVKPANIVLCSRGGVHDTVKVLDFGLVKETTEQAAKITAVNAIMGTPAFIAPELIESSAHGSPASDVYSLGATAYFMLTGHFPFERPEVMQILMAHLSQRPPPPSEHAVEIPTDLEQIILRCMAKAVEERFASMEALAEALLECKDAHTWTQRMTRAWWDTHREAVRSDGAVTEPSPTQSGPLGSA